MTIKKMIMIALLLFSGSLIASDPIIQAKNLMQQGKAQQAFSLLLPLEGKYAGTPDYDFLLGISALDVGKASMAVMALERVLTIDPNHLPARAEIARAYLLLGDKRGAKKTFKQVQVKDIPKQVSQNIQKYLDMLAEGLTGKNNFSVWAEAGMGYDSNVNSATSTSNVAVPALGGLPVNLTNSSLASEDMYMSLGGGASFTQSITQDVQWIGSVRVKNIQLASSENNQFETSEITGTLGVSKTLSATEKVNTSVIAQKFNVGHDPYRTMAGANVSYLKTLGPNQAVNLSAQALKLNYETQTIRDANRFAVGGGYIVGLNLPLKTVMTISGSVGIEEETANNAEHFGHHFLATNVSANVTIDPKLTLITGLGYQYRNYGGQDPSFLMGREDHQYDVSVKLDYKVDTNLAVTPQMRYTRNESSIPINNYDRTSAGVNVRYVFE